MKRLTLRKETLTALDPDELHAIVGGFPTTGRGVPTVQWCPETDAYPTLPVVECTSTTYPG